MFEAWYQTGCPSSPILFAMVMEILAIVMMNDDCIRGITIDDPSNKIYKSEVHLEMFGEITGLQINGEKSDMIYLILKGRQKIIG